MMENPSMFEGFPDPPPNATLASLIGFVDNAAAPTPIANNADALIATTLTFGLTSAFCVLFRLYTRVYVLKAPGWDDFFGLLFMIMGLVGTICLCIAPTYGFGRHYVDLDTYQRREYLKLFYLWNASFVTSSAFIKASLLLQYLRVYDRGLMRLVCWAVLGLVAVWGTILFFIAWLPCFPVAAYWDWTLDGATCYGWGSKRAAEYYHTFLGQAVSNMSLDGLIFLLPVPLFWRPGTNKRVKFGLVGLLLVGVLVVNFAMWRLFTVMVLRAATFPLFDPTWEQPTLSTLSMLEANVAAICAAVPIFWPVLSARLDAAWDRIFVTREIKVSVADNETRDDYGYGYGQGDGDTVALRSVRSGGGDEDGDEGGDGDEDGVSSRAGTPTSAMESSAPTRSASGSRSRGGGGGGAGSHYANEYVMDQVDPLRKKTTLAVESEITSGGGEPPLRSKRSSRSWL